MILYVLSVNRITFLYVGFVNIRILSMIQTDCRVSRLGGFFYIDVLNEGILRVETDEFF